ncbi:hypothetical protein MHU86_18050 [Fragilaria crotonensis]|nr:hypothetical protein MHU86_18050 [Fragilaria crotonensis]
MNQNLNTTTTVTVQDIFDNSALSNEDVIFFGDQELTNKYSGNQQFKFLIQKCIQYSLLKIHGIDNIAEAFWKCHEPRKFMVLDGDSASYSELSKADAVDLIKYALGEQEDLTFFERAWDWVNVNADQGIISGDDEADAAVAYLKCFPLDDRDGSEIETFPINSSLDWENCRQHHFLDDLYDSARMQAINQDDTTEKSSKRSRPTLDDLPRRGLHPNNHHLSDNANEPAGACHIKPYPVSLPLAQQKRFSKKISISSKMSWTCQQNLKTNLFDASRLTISRMKSTLFMQAFPLITAITCQLPPPNPPTTAITHLIRETYTEPTDGNHLAPYPRCVPPEQQFCFYREELDPSKNVLARSLPAHNEQVQEHASDTGLSSDNRHHLSDTSSEPTDATHLAPSSISLSTNQHLWLTTDDLDLFKSLLDEPTESQDDRDQSLSHHNERALENSFHTGLPPDGQMGSNAIFWFDCSQINSLNFRTDIGANQAECQLIAAGSVLNHHDVQALGLLLIQALLWLARN